MQRLPMSYFDRNPMGPGYVTRALLRTSMPLNDLFAAGRRRYHDSTTSFSSRSWPACSSRSTAALLSTRLAVLPGILIVTMIFRKFVRDANRRIRTAIARNQRFSSGIHFRMSVVQLFNRERKAVEEFEKRNRDNMLAWRDAILAYAPTLLSGRFEFLLSFATIALIYWSGGNRILSGTLTLGVLTAFTMFAQRFFPADSRP